MFNKTDIAKHYEYCEAHYTHFWNLQQSKSMHYGYWDDSTRNFHEALLNINLQLSRKANITESNQVLDAGCGVGGSTLWLAKNIGCKTTGITLSDVQRSQAEAFAKDMGLSDRASFLQADYTNTGFAAESFDVVWAIESVCHADDKKKFLSEAFRLLKPGGRLILADFFKQYGLTGADKEMMDKMAHGWAVESFATVEEFEKAASEVGFKGIVLENASPAIRRSAKKLYWFSFPGMFMTKLYDLVFKASHLSKYNARTAYLQYKALKKGLWKYVIIQATK